MTIWGIFVASFALIFVAELAGKTTLTTIMLAVGSHPWEVFLGAGAALTLHVCIAVALGGLLSFLPPSLVQSLVGVLFLGLGAWMWMQTNGLESEKITAAGFGKSFGLIFLAQWGDPSQLATAALAAKYGAFPVFIPATLGFWSIVGLASWLGHFSKTRLPARKLHQIAAILFAVVGVSLLIKLLYGAH